jgi:hypothetical protein
MNYETSGEIEIAIARWFGIRKYVIVPNVSWGFLPYEADMLILTKSKYVWEVEIKVSRSDLLRDGNKRHQHNTPKVRKLWFAIPEKLEGCIEQIPERAGVLVVDRTGRVTTSSRSPTANPIARKLSDEECFQLARLGALRVWPLKEKIAKLASKQTKPERDRLTNDKAN